MSDLLSDSVVAIDRVTRRFGATAALDRVSLGVPRGSVFGLVGENGAGKTTLIKHVMGLFKPQEGSVRVFGLDPVADPVGVLARVGYLSEDRDLPEWMRIWELLRYLRPFYPTWDDSLAEELLVRFELDVNAQIKTLSQGQRARTALLSALAYRPELLVLDEPSTGLDPIVRRDILTAIIKTIADEGRTVLFSSHLLEEVERVSDRVAMMSQGRIVLDGPLDEIKESHRRVTLRFDEPQSISPYPSFRFEGNGDGREWTGVYDGSIEILAERVVSLGGRIVSANPISLDEIFVARVERSKADRLSAKKETSLDLEL
jgi:ABC-2 type transport system ATP-binding protein